VYLFRSESGRCVKRILLADDSAVVRRTLRHLFEQAGWSICGEASNGQEVIAKAQECKPDLIVLDLSMPVMNGFTAGRILKRVVPETPLILFTAFSGVIKSSQLRGAGFSASIDKSEAGKLLATAQSLLKAA
jgi:two-component system, response regulator PdtaR